VEKRISRSLPGFVHRKNPVDDSSGALVFSPVNSLIFR